MVWLARFAVSFRSAYLLNLESLRLSDHIANFLLMPVGGLFFYGFFLHFAKLSEFALFFMYAISTFLAYCSVFRTINKRVFH